MRNRLQNVRQTGDTDANLITFQDLKSIFEYITSQQFNKERKFIEFFKRFSYNNVTGFNINCLVKKMEVLLLKEIQNHNKCFIFYFLYTLR